MIYYLIILLYDVCLIVLYTKIIYNNFAVSEKKNEVGSRCENVDGGTKWGGGGGNDDRFAIKCKNNQAGGRDIARNMYKQLLCTTQLRTSSVYFRQSDLTGGGGYRKFSGGYIIEVNNKRKEWILNIHFFPLK